MSDTSLKGARDTRNRMAQYSDTSITQSKTVNLKSKTTRGLATWIDSFPVGAIEVPERRPKQYGLATEKRRFDRFIVFTWHDLPFCN